MVKESRGMFFSDEARKMAYTDALSVAAKMIGVAADVYMGHGSKYDRPNGAPEPNAKPSNTQTSSSGANVAPNGQGNAAPSNTMSDREICDKLIEFGGDENVLASYLQSKSVMVNDQIVNRVRQMYQMVNKTA